MDNWRALAARQHGVIRRGAADLSRARAEREVRSGALVPVGRHALLAATGAGTHERALWVAVIEAGPPAVVSGAAALWLYGVPVDLPDRPELLIPRCRTRRRIACARVRRVVTRELVRARTARGLPVASVPVAVRRAAPELPFTGFWSPPLSTCCDCG